MKLRAWQQEALEVYNKESRKVFFLQACPGAGKTKFTLTALQQEIKKRGKGNTFIIVVTPSEPLKYSWSKEAAGFGIQLKVRAGDGTFPGVAANYQGIVITYHSLGSYLALVKQWQRQAGYKFVLVCDEIHHTSESNSWGVDSLEYGELCDKVIFLSGTPNRTDRYKIPLAEYIGAVLEVDYRYGYRQALVDHVCREAEVRLIAFETASALMSTGEVFEYDSESISESEESKVLRRALDTRLNLASEMIRVSWEEIQKMRSSGDRNAACLVRCLTSSKAGAEDGYISQVEKLIKKITGCTDDDIEVVHSGIDDSTERIARFRKSEKTFLISIRQVTEGVDIPRLRVLLHLDNTTADLTLNQELGRVTRYEDKHDDLQYAVIIMPDIPSYRDFAKRILDDVIEAAKEFEDIEAKDQGEKGENKEPLVTLYSEPTTTSSVMSGESYSHEDSLMKEALLLGSKRQCASMPTSSILNVLKAQQETSEDDDCFSAKNLAELNEYPFTQTKTNDEICHDLRRQISKVVNRVSALKIKGKETQKEVYNKMYELYDLKTPDHFKGRPIDFIEMKYGPAGLEKLLMITNSLLRNPRS